MQLTKQRLIDDTMALTRCLTVISPDYPNRALAIQEALQKEKVESGTTMDQWYKVVCGGDVGFYHIKSDGSGLYSRTASDKAATKKLRTVEVDPKATPAFARLSELSALLDGLSEGKQLKITGTRETIELAGGDSGDETVMSLRGYVEVVRRAVSPGYNEEIATGKLARLRDIALLDERDTKAAMKKRLVDIADEVAKLRSILGADGFLASFFLIYRDVCLEVEKHFGAAKGKDQLSAAKFSTYLGMCSTGSIHDPEALSSMLIKKLSHEGMHVIAAQLGHNYLKKAEGFIEQALGSNTLDSFGGALYTAGLYFLSAWQIFRVLAASSASGDAKENSEYQRAASHADERAVRIGTSFIHAVENRTGEKLLKHQAMVETARRKGGNAAAQQQIFELIEMSYYYPRYFEKVLWGETAAARAG